MKKKKKKKKKKKHFKDNQKQKKKKKKKKKKKPFQDNHTHKINHANYCANCSCIIEIKLYLLSQRSELTLSL